MDITRKIADHLKVNEKQVAAVITLLDCRLYSSALSLDIAKKSLAA